MNPGGRGRGSRCCRHGCAHLPGARVPWLRGCRAQGAGRQGQRELVGGLLLQHELFFAEIVVADRGEIWALASFMHACMAS